MTVTSGFREPWVCPCACRARLRKRQERDAVMKEQRTKATSLLCDGKKRSAVVKITKVPREAIDRIYRALKADDDLTLDALLSPEASRRGRRTVISQKESELIKKRIKFAAEKGFALSNGDLRKIMTDIASDGRAGFQTESGSPSQDTIRHWRAINRDVTSRKAENKDIAKLKPKSSDMYQLFQTH